jgi:hypothetical protein
MNTSRNVGRNSLLRPENLSHTREPTRNLLFIHVYLTIVFQATARGKNLMKCRSRLPCISSSLFYHLRRKNIGIPDSHEALSCTDATPPCRTTYNCTYCRLGTWRYSCGFLDLGFPVLTCQAHTVRNNKCAKKGLWASAFSPLYPITPNSKEWVL